MLLSWYSTEGSQVKLEDSISTIQRNLEFLGPRVEKSNGTPTTEELQGHSAG